MNSFKYSKLFLGALRDLLIDKGDLHSVKLLIRTIFTVKIRIRPSYEAVISASDSAKALNCMIRVQKKLNKTHVHRCGHSLSLQINKSLQSC